VLNVCGVEQVAMGADPAIHVKLTVTGVLFHPFAFGGGVRVAVILGLSKSILTVLVLVALFPARSVTVAVTC
jgi:hypothetical protein